MKFQSREEFQEQLDPNKRENFGVFILATGTISQVVPDTPQQQSTAGICSCCGTMPQASADQYKSMYGAQGKKYGRLIYPIRTTMDTTVVVPEGRESIEIPDESGVKLVLTYLTESFSKNSGGY